MDEQHTAKLYSRFFAELMAKMFPAGSSSSRSKSVVGAERKKNEQQSQSQSQNQSNADAADSATTTTDYAVAAVHHQPEWNEQRGDSFDGPQTELRLGNESSHMRYFPEQAHAVRVEPQQYTYPKVVDEAVFSDGQHHAQPQPQSQPPQYQYQEEANIYPANIGTGVGTLPLALGNVHVNVNVNADVSMTDEAMSLPALTTEEYILSMQAINNPRWWDNVMMPGFSWPVHPSANANVSAGAGAGVPGATEQLHGHDHHAPAPATAPVQAVGVEVGSYQYQQVRYESSVEQTLPGQGFILLGDGHGHAHVDAASGAGAGAGEPQQVPYSATQQYPSAVAVVDGYYQQSHQTLPVDPSSGAYQFVGQTRSY